MEIKVCEKCGSMDTSEDTMTGKHTCLKCGEETSGKIMEFTGTRDREKTINPNRRTNPFQIQSTIRSPKKLL